MKKLLTLFLCILLIPSVSAYTIYYYHNDNQGNPIAITDEDSNIVWKAEYEPFGSIFNEEEIETSNKYNYNTKELDKNTDLLYYGNRYYDSNLGRFTTADTIKGSLDNPQSLNRYSYTLNNPLKYIDPSGNQGEKPNRPTLIFNSHDIYSDYDLKKIRYVLDFPDKKLLDKACDDFGAILYRYEAGSIDSLTAESLMNKKLEKLFKKGVNIIAQPEDDSSLVYHYIARDLKKFSNVVSQIVERGGAFENIILRAHGVPFNVYSPLGKSLTYYQLRFSNKFYSNFEASNLISSSIDSSMISEGGSFIITTCYGSKCINLKEIAEKIGHIVYASNYEVKYTTGGLGSGNIVFGIFNKYEPEQK